MAGHYMRVALLSIIVILPSRSLAQVRTVPGDSFRGAQLLAEKGCRNCHGAADSSAPDLEQRGMRIYDPYLLASVMWNHGPTMWSELDSRGQSVPTFTLAETADMFAYFYSIMYFSELGDAARGRAVFVERSCSRCHATDASEDRIGPPTSTWTRARDLIDWVEDMWNHAERMIEETERLSISWPSLSDQQMIDLIVYIHALTDDASQPTSFSLGDPTLGESVFRSNCERCHTLGESLPDRIDLFSRNARPNVMGYASAMWNHAPRMALEAGRIPSLESGSMRHLMAYLFSRRYFDDTGDASRGERVFREKSCVLCHPMDGNSDIAPDLFGGRTRHSFITMVQAIWNHGPGMLTAFQDRNIYWPLFEGAQMKDLIEFLNSQ